MSLSYDRLRRAACQAAYGSICWQPSTGNGFQASTPKSHSGCGWQFFAEAPLTGLKVTLTDVALTAPADLGTNPNKLALPAANLSDVYSPCMLPQNSGNDAVYVVSLPAGQSDTLNAVLCSPGGYYQVCTSVLPAALPALSVACPCVHRSLPPLPQMQLKPTNRGPRGLWPAWAHSTCPCPAG